MTEFISSKSARLDQELALYLKISRNQVLSLIKGGNVSVNDKVVTKAGFNLNLDDKISFILPQTTQIQSEFKAEFDVEILYEDSDILVINKPIGVTVHPAPSVKEATLVEWLKQKNYTLSTIGGVERAGIVHRLDKGTSGVMVVAKNNESHASLSSQLSSKDMGRIYLALCDLPLKENCIIDRPIGRHPQNRLKNTIVNGAKSAKSAFANILTTQNKRVNLIAAKLFTGRTHQIRVHLASINRHILGDDLYGFKSNSDRISRIFLHAYILRLIHPKSNQIMEFKAPLPNEFYELIGKEVNKEIVDESITPSILCDIFRDSSYWMYYN
ncbi:RluA family pseudouridine synthase [Campylobacter vicugnae]|uniref:RluA family pseudouridine synthase n=1 Tax=Campylobacter vicugnae TaxID=1660076 RepID=UPI002549C706|nr:RluA family pseudouridine synthase [Campylobacter ovis]MDL0104690.1 RluA family pseudouridine synthase [Campylobacter ovis]MDL0106132.1 RluA family pseudouridine synthase [Campylobacter ovis]